ALASVTRFSFLVTRGRRSINIVPTPRGRARTGGLRLRSPDRNTRHEQRVTKSKAPVKMAPQEYGQTKAAGSGSSFYYSFLFLPEERRRAITALYAFCREVDDVVDDCSDVATARATLAWWL